MAGYSGTPLAKKLGIKPGFRVALLGAPERFEKMLEPLPENVDFFSQARGPIDVIVFFTRRSGELKKQFPKLAAALAPAGGLWIAWPKRTSGLETDLSFDIVYQTGLASGLVDNKVCAIDDIWSGLRFVIRLKDRPEAISKRKK